METTVAQALALLSPERQASAGAGDQACQEGLAWCWQQVAEGSISARAASQGAEALLRGLLGLWAITSTGPGSDGMPLRTLAWIRGSGELASPAADSDLMRSCIPDGTWWALEGPASIETIHELDRELLTALAERGTASAICWADLARSGNRSRARADTDRLELRLCALPRRQRQLIGQMISDWPGSLGELIDASADILAGHGSAA